MWLSSWLNRFGLGRNPVLRERLRARRGRPARRLSVERLEDRLAPSAGALDTTFGTGGKVITDFKASNDHGNAVALQTDGKIVLVGSTDFGGGGNNFAVARYNHDGTLDTSFDFDGKVFTDFGGIKDEARGVAIQADGKIVVAGIAGFSSPDFALARYNPDGSLDKSFSTDGMVTTDFAAGADFGFALALQGDGKIVVAGAAEVDGSINFALARYNPDGSPDRTFDVDGKVNTDFSGEDDVANGVVLQSDGKIVAAGFADDRFALARYDTDGFLDSTFDFDGRVTTDFDTVDLAHNVDRASSVALQSDGKIVVAGVMTLPIGNFSSNSFALARYNADGDLDHTFGGNGKVVEAINFNLGAVDVANSVLIQPTGDRIVAAGFTHFDAVNDFALARFHLDGSSDPSFGDHGTVTTDFGGDDTATGMVLQADGKIVVVGSADRDFALARYEGVAPEIAVDFGGTDVHSGSTVAFGSTPVGTPVQKTLTIRNLGNLNLTVSSITVPAGFQPISFPSFPLQLAPDAETSMSVRLIGSTAGDFTGKLSIGNNDGDENPFLIGVTGTVLAPAHEIQVLTGTRDIPDNTGVVNFGTFLVVATATRTFTVRNIGNTSLTLGPSISMSAPFFLASGFGSTTLAAGASTTFAVGFSSTSVGTFSSQVSFATNDSDENPFNFTVTGAVSLTNTAPKIRGESLTRQVNEGGVATLRGHLVDPDPHDKLFLRINWGDGSPTETHAPGRAPFVFRHRYRDDAPRGRSDDFRVHLTWFDSGGASNSKTLRVRVHNVAPQVRTGPPVLLQAGQTLQRVGSFTDPGLDSWAATVDYGDGGGLQPLPLQPDLRFILEHQYQQPGIFLVRVRVLDDDGGVGTATLAVTVLPNSVPGPPRPDHIVVVIEENHDLSQVIGSADAPYLNSLAQQGALLTASFGIDRPSQPNYLDLFSGSDQGVTSNARPAGLPFTTANLGAQLRAAGLSFVGFAESLPSVGFDGDSFTGAPGQNQYERKHNPWTNWVNDPVGANQLPASVNQPFTSFPTDFTQLPTVAFVVPNEQNDMHDGTIRQGDDFLRNNLDAYVQWARNHNSMLIVTFDEDGSTPGNDQRIPTIFVGPMVKPGSTLDRNVNHFDILRTLEDMYGLPAAGAAAGATPIMSIWTPPPHPVPNAAFVTALYRQLLGRAPDAGFAHWLAELRAGVPRDVVALDFWVKRVRHAVGGRVFGGQRTVARGILTPRANDLRVLEDFFARFLHR